GFNKYYPPDYDGEKHGSLNSYRGKHPSHQSKARKIGQGILITRFELPFNIWCGTCNNHIGMGVRYNAEKKKIGNYYSTPIFSFRCKCHLCDGWFEIQTDPKNTRYVVVSGARQKDEDWDPEENGGFAVHGKSEGAAAPVDPLAALEKTTDAQNHLTNVQVPRLESLQTASEHYNADPYALSSKVRQVFRHEKKIETAKRKADDEIKGRYALPAEMKLLEDDEQSHTDAREEWQRRRSEFEARERKRRKFPAASSLALPTSNSKSQTVNSLRARILGNTAKKNSS
ncbi:CWC16 protein, partial [Armillaria novae-zelandiae]